MKTNKVLTGLFLSAVLSASMLAREVVFDVSKIQFNASMEAPTAQVYKVEKSVVKTNLLECSEHNAKCSPFDQTLGVIEVQLNQPIANFTVNHTIKKPRDNKATDLIISDEFGDAVVVSFNTYGRDIHVVFNKKEYDVPEGADSQVDTKLVGEKNKVTLYINGIETASVKTTMTNLKTVKENFNGDKEKADKLDRLVITNDSI